MTDTSTPAPDETFPPTGGIPRVPPPWDDEPEPPPADPFRQLGDAAVRAAAGLTGSLGASAPGVPVTVPSPEPPSRQQDLAAAPPPPPPAPPPEAWGRSAELLSRASTWLVVGLLVAVVLSSAAAATVFRMDPVLDPPDQHVIPLPSPSFSPYEPSEPTPFLASLPRATLVYGLTGAEPVTAAERFAWPARNVEGWSLVYEDGQGGVMTVVAFQHYNTDDAELAFQELLAVRQPPAADGEGPSPSPSPSPGVELRPVTARSGEVVGQSFRVEDSLPADEEGGAETPVVVITWRNATAVFVMTGDPAVVDELFLEYGL